MAKRAQQMELPIKLTLLQRRNVALAKARHLRDHWVLRLEMTVAQPHGRSNGRLFAALRENERLSRQNIELIDEIITDLESRPAPKAQRGGEKGICADFPNCTKHTSCEVIQTGWERKIRLLSNTDDRVLQRQARALEKSLADFANNQARKRSGGIAA